MKILLLATLMPTQAAKFNPNKQTFSSKDKNTIVRVEREGEELTSLIYKFSQVQKQKKH